MSSSQHKQAPASTPLVQSTVGHCSTQGELQSSHVTQLTQCLLTTDCIFSPNHGAGGAGPGERGGGRQPRHGRHQRQGGRVRQVKTTERQFLGSLHDHLHDL